MICKLFSTSSLCADKLVEMRGVFRTKTQTDGYHECEGLHNILHINMSACVLKMSFLRGLFACYNLISS